MNLKELRNEELIDLHKRVSNNRKLTDDEKSVRQWELDRELFERAHVEMNTPPTTTLYDSSGDVYASTYAASNCSHADSTITNVGTGTVDLDNSSITGGINYVDTSGCLYYVNTLNYVTYFTIHAKYDGRDYLVSENEYPTHQQARDALKPLLKLPSDHRIELITDRGTFNEYDYPKLDDVERFYIRQQVKGGVSPIDWYTTTSFTADSTLTTVGNITTAGSITTIGD